MAALDFPDTPTLGQVYDKWTWNGTQWVLTSTGGARGQVAYAEVTATQASIGTTAVDLTGLSVTFTPTAGRRYKVTAHAYFVSSGGGPIPVTANLTLIDGSTQRQGCSVYIPVANVPNKAHLEWVFTAAGGAATFKLQGAIINGPAGTISMLAGPLTPNFILVEDINP